MTGKLEIQWSSVPNKFITWGGGEIGLYQVLPISAETQVSNVSQLFKISDSHCAKLVTTNTNHHSVRSIDIYPKCESDLLLAIGLVNGRVSLSTFGSSEHDVYGFPGKEFVPKHGRNCNAVLFNPHDCNLIAAGLDKYRSDSSILIWDINKFAANNNYTTNSRMVVNTMAPAVELVKPVTEFGTSEVTYSLAWFYGSSRLLTCGMNAKNIKIYDLRDPNKMVNATLTKAVFGVSTNPNDDRHISSFFDNQICIWDIRNFEKPVVILPQSKPLVKIAWCPTKYSTLGALLKDSSVINLFDIQHTFVGSEDVEPTLMERIVSPGSPHNITSFSWHSKDENRLLSIAVSGTIKDYTVFDRITINWSTASNFAWSHGSKILRVIEDSFLDDISHHIKARAKSRYGLQEEFRKNADLVRDNASLANVWNWLQLTEKLTEDGIIRDSEFKHPGVLYILSNLEKSDTISIAWSELGYPNCQSSALYYRSDDREKILNICCWPVDRESSYLSQCLDHLEKAKAYTRAAAIAVFNLKVQLAIEILGRASSDSEFGSSLNIVAMALSGFSDDPNSAWRKNCATSIAKLTDPYLKAMFSFLTADNYDYSDVLNERGIAVDDRVALACLYLPDDKLLEYMEQLNVELSNDGNLDGLLVTGNSVEGLKLLQKYLDNTADIQSTTIIAMRAFHDHLASNAVKNWIENYRDLLNSWRLYHERADFDIMLAQFMLNEKPPQQVYVSCNFCGKSISAYLQRFDRERGQFQRSSSVSKVKMSSCPNCRKPLPRCAICLMHMGTMTGDSDPAKVTGFDNWFTWCQTCRHGGHADHLSQWFEEHQECPVTGCTCRCFAIDAAVSKW